MKDSANTKNKNLIKQKHISILASCGMLLTAAIWGFAFVVVKDSLNSVPPIYMLAFRFSIASIAISLIFVKKFMLMTKEILLHGIILGFFLFASYAFQTIGCQYTTAGKNAFLTAIYVVLIPFFLWALTKHSPNIKIFLAAFLAITGIALLSLQKDLSINFGDVLTMICGIGFALHIIFIAKFNATEDAILLTILQLVFAAIFSWILAPFLDGDFPLLAFQNQQTIFSMLYLGIISTMIAFFLQNICQKYTPTTVASLLLSLESVFGVIFSCIFLGEVLTLRMIIGCFLIFIAITLA